jgi:hypothetical protein
MKIKIFDNAFAHEDYCGSKIGKNFSKHIIWDRSFSNIEENDLVFFTDSLLPMALNIRTNCIKIALLLEPPSVNNFAYDFISKNHHEFDYIITHQDTLSSISKNVIILPQWCTWIYPEKQKIFEKHKNLSIIASDKKSTEGQVLRHDIVNYLQSKINIDLYGGLTSGNSGYNPITDKSDGLSDYMFSIIVENSKYNYYFTEKIIDCLLTGTVPIYWGANKIDEFFDIRGFLIVDNIKDLDNIIPKLNKETYDEMLPFITNNFKIASEFLTLEDFIYEKFIKKYEL